MKQRPLSRLLAWALTICLVVSMVPGMAVSATTGGSETTASITLGTAVGTGTANEYTFPSAAVTGDLSVFSISVDSGSFKLKENSTTGFSYGVKSATASDATVTAGTAYTSVQYSGQNAADAIKSITFTKETSKNQTVTVSGMNVSLNSGDVFFDGHIYQLSENQMSWEAAMEWSLGKSNTTYTNSSFFPAPLEIDSLTENLVLVNFYSQGSKNIWLSAVPKSGENDTWSITYDNSSEVTITGTPTVSDTSLSGSAYRWLRTENSTLPNNSTDAMASVWHSGEPSMGGGPIYFGYSGAYWDDLTTTDWTATSSSVTKYGVTEWFTLTQNAIVTGTATVKDSDISGIATVGTLDELKSALNNANIKEIKLSANIPTASETAETITISAGREIIIDLAGFTLTGGNSGIEVSGNLTVKDSSENKTGKIIGTQDGIKIPSTANNAKVTVNGGTIQGGNYAIFDNSTTTTGSVTGGTLIGGMDTAWKGALGGNSTDKGGSWTIATDGSVILGSTDEVSNPANLIRSDTLTSVNSSNNDIAYVKQTDSSYKVMKGYSDATTINNYLSADTTTEDPIYITLNGDVSDGGIVVPQGKTVILDLNGHSITTGTCVTNNGTLTVMDSDPKKNNANGLMGSAYGVMNNGNLTVNSGYIQGTGHEGIQNTGSATACAINGGTISGGYAAICDIAGTSKTFTIGKDATLIRTGTGWDTNGYVINSYGTKGATYTIDDGATLQNTVPGKWVNTDPSTGTAVSNGQVGLTDAANKTYTTTGEGPYTATVGTATRQTTMVLNNGEIFYSIEPTKHNDIVRFDFQFYAAPVGTYDFGQNMNTTRSVSGWQHMGFVKANYTDTQAANQKGLTKIAPVTGTDWNATDSTQVTFTGTMDMATLTTYNGTALATTKLGGTNPYLWVSICPCNSITSDFDEYTWICLGKFDSWPEAARLDDPSAAADAAKSAIEAMENLPGAEDNTGLDVTTLTGKVDTIKTEITNAETEKDSEGNSTGYYTTDGKLTIAKAQAKLDAITMAARLADKIGAMQKAGELSEDEAAALLTKVSTMLSDAISAIDNATGDTATTTINTAVSNMQAKASGIEAAADALARINAMTDLTDAQKTSAKNGINGTLDKLITWLCDGNNTNDTADTIWAAAMMEAEVIAAGRINDINAMAKAGKLLPDDQKKLILAVNTDLSTAKTALDALYDNNTPTVDAAELILEKLRAKAAINEAAAEAYADINADANMTDVQKAAAKNSIDTIVTEYNGKIDAADSSTAVETAKLEGIEKIKQSAADAIIDALAKKYGLSNETVADLKAKVAAILAETKTNVAGAADDEAAALAQAKGDAKIDALLKAEAAKAAINAMNLTDEEKAASCNKIDEALKEAISTYTTGDPGSYSDGSIDNAANADQLALAAAKADAKMDISLAEASALSDINGLSNMDDTQKTALKTGVTNKASTAMTDIGNAETESAVTTAKESGAADIFVAAYLTGTDGTVYTSASYGNYRQIKAGSDNWNALNDAEQAKVNEALKSANNGTELTYPTLLSQANGYPIVIPSSSVSVAESANGTITVDKPSASAGQTVTITVTPDNGYELGTLTVTDSNGTAVELTDLGNGQYTFTMPASRPVTIQGTFVAVQGETWNCDGGESCPAKKFADVDTTEWYHQAVDYVIENGLMKGTDKGFEPMTTTSRGMIVTILYRLEGEPSTAGLENPFDDLTQDWYLDAVIWAASNKIVEGWDGSFNPEDAITREQLAAILWRYAKYKGYDVSLGERTDIRSYTDAEQISDWAVPAMQWAVGEEILQGYAGKLSPADSSKRCEAAAMLMRFLN